MTSFITIIIIIIIIIIIAVVIIILIVIIFLDWNLTSSKSFSHEVILQKLRPCELAHRLMLQRLDKKLKSAYETWLKNNKKNDIK